MPRAIITGTGHYVPPLVISNEDLSGPCETSDAWIQERTGIRERRYILPGQTSSQLGVFAAKRALADAEITAQDLDCIIFATLSPDYSFPGAGCLAQAALGAPNIPAFDLRNQCSGFLYGLRTASAFIEAGIYRRVLLIGAEVHSTGLDFSRRGRSLSVLFGDGGGAVILEGSEDEGRGLLSMHVGADGRQAKTLWCDGPTSSRAPERINAKILAEGEGIAQFPQMKGRVVFKHAVRKMLQEITNLLDAEGLTPADIKVLIPHQANLRISEHIRRRLSLRPDQVFNNIQRYGNTTAASIPIALDEYARSGQLKPGDLIAFAAFGSGFTWGAALLRW